LWRPESCFRIGAGGVDRHEASDLHVQPHCRNLERIAALSDGLFAIAMTLIVLDIRVPPETAVHSEADFGRALMALSPRIVMYLMSFLTLGIFWVGQQTQLNYLARADRDLAWIHIAFLAGVATMPFSTTLLAEFISYRTAMLIYWVNLLLLGLTLYWSWRHARHAGLIKPARRPTSTRPSSGGSSSLSRFMPWAWRFASSARFSASPSSFWCSYYAIAPRIKGLHDSS